MSEQPPAGKPPRQKRLGEYLVERKVITPDQLNSALDAQTQSGGLLGEIVLAQNDSAPLAIAEALAAHSALPHANLLETPPQKALLDLAVMDDYLRLEAVPWYVDTLDDAIIIATTSPNDALYDWAKARFPRYRLAITSRRDIHQSLQLAFPEHFTQLGREKLWRRFPWLSARQTVAYKQKLLVLSILTFMFCGWISFPSDLALGLVLIVDCFYIATLLFKTVLFAIGIRKREWVWQRNLTGTAPNIMVSDAGNSSSDTTLPLYSILIPLYDEAQSLPGLLEALRNLDYPASKLDIKLIIEADDATTMAKAKELRPEGRFEIIPVPYSLPRTKPKACNYALRFAKGEFVTIYDAEDRPDPQQLRKVVRAFRQGPGNLVCVQCRLNYYNREHNLLTRLFAIEYAAWFDYMLPALDYLNLPIPLGGTSNHIALQRLKDLGEWDAYNVTEDADLGIRMAAHRYRTLTLESLTMEEAPPALWMWVKQRSRWIKGYMQTWLVHMRHPLRLWRQLGPRGFFGFQLFIGGPCLVFLSAPMLLLFSCYWMIRPMALSGTWLDMVLPLSSGIFLYGLALHFLLGMRVVSDREWKHMLSALLVFPFYWLLHSFASFRALHQLLARPHYWDKTSHQGDSTAFYKH